MQWHDTGADITAEHVALGAPTHESGSACAHQHRYTGSALRVRPAGHSGL